jgi:flagellum-specific peptidoglycan hydrolase FlgJ
MKRQEFINEVAKYAKEDYQRSKVLPSLTIAQAILESGWGQSGLTKQTNNLFGIKAFSSWKGDKKVFRTREVYNGKETYVDAAFRAYPTFEGSVKDHNDLLMKPRYKKVVATTDYKVAANEIRLAGYATDPEYTKLLIRLIEQFDLHEYDKEVQEYMISKKDADAIIKILKEKYAEGVARQDEDMKKEAGRLADEVRKASGQKPQN